MCTCVYPHAQKFFLPCMTQCVFHHAQLQQQGPHGGQSWIPFPPFLCCLFLPVKSTRRVSGMAYMKEDYHYSACYMFSESLYAHISFTHWVKIQVKKCKRDLWPSIYCSSACSCQKYLVFLQAWKTHEKQLYR